ncbi:MAG: class I SAM-dependent methyltransferase [Verrucomicrobia bacterium]|nr:class I SAM-dependent methyltransferase [Verrucomicrobiota bacterium]
MNARSSDPLPPALREESCRLADSWMRHDQAWLRDYLVQGVEDPRRNVQSILTRHFLAERLIGIDEGWARLMDHELRFALAVNWLETLAEEAIGPEETSWIRYGLEHSAGEVEGVVIPEYVLDTAERLRSRPRGPGGLPIPDYLSKLLDAAERGRGRIPQEAPERSLFLDLWRQALAALPPPQSRPLTLEPGCGSANDYRAIAACGLAERMDYLGLDICEKNVANAKALCPEARFETGNALELPVADGACELAFAHDLFEHLSPAALERAVKELCRVVRGGLCLGFFKMHEEPDHVVRRVEDYHWNTLSADRIRKAFEECGFETQVVHIDTFLRAVYGCADTHNKDAYTLFCRRKAASSGTNTLSSETRKGENQQR